MFDMDGVVIDSHPLTVRAWQKSGTVGREVSEAELDFVLDGRKLVCARRSYATFSANWSR